MTDLPAENASPSAWRRSPLGDVADVQLGKMLDKAKHRKGQRYPYLRNLNVRWGRFDLDDLAEMYFEEGELQRYSVRPGDVIACEGGVPGRSAVWTRSGESILYQKALHRIRPVEGLSPHWVVYNLLHDCSTGRLESLFTGTTIRHLTRTSIRRWEVTIPPTAEQLRIVEALDSYLSRLDSAQAALERVKANLDRYRASVLQAAVEGRLVRTEAQLAADEGRDYEPADMLLQRILLERRRRWEEVELAKMRAKGKEPKNDTWRSKYKEPVAPDATDLPELPEGWCWASLDGVADIQGGLQKGKKRRLDQVLRSVPYLRVANVQRGFLNLAEVKSIDATEVEIERLRLRHGDVLFNEGGDRDKLGRGWIWANELPECVHQNHVFRARPAAGSIEPKFLSWYGNSAGQRYFFDAGKHTTNLASLNLTKLRRLPVPLPPLAEQRRIVESLDEMLSISTRAASFASKQVLRMKRLRRSILKWAFEGKLVDQDPNDEPASVLLERIRAERAANPPKRPRHRRKAAAT